MVDTAGTAWSWSHDSLGRLFRKNDPDAGIWNYEYDDASRIRAQVDAKGQRTEWDYDAAGRLATKVGPDQAVTFTYSQPRVGYFNVGGLTSFSDAQSSVTLDYDAEGRLLRSVRSLDGQTYTVERRYDSAGYLRGMTYPDGDTAGTPTNPLRYDAAGHLTVIPGVLTNVIYDAVGSSGLAD